MIRAGGVMAARLFPTERSGSIPTSALQLRFSETENARFAALNREWHRTLPEIGALNTLDPCYAASFDGECYAVAAWSNPVARELPQRTWRELRRFAIAPDRPKNTASRMLGWMVRDIHRRMPQIVRLISYQDADTHLGTIYKAAGWVPVITSRGGGWDNRKRWDRIAKRLPNKIRWEFTFISQFAEANEKHIRGRKGKE